MNSGSSDQSAATSASSRNSRRRVQLPDEDQPKSNLEDPAKKYTVRKVQSATTNPQRRFKDIPHERTEAASLLVDTESGRPRTAIGSSTSREGNTPSRPSTSEADNLVTPRRGSQRECWTPEPPPYATLAKQEDTEDKGPEYIPPTPRRGVEIANAEVVNVYENRNYNNMPDAEGGFPVRGASAKLLIAGGVVALIAAVSITLIASSVHQVNEGNVGIYFKNGALMESFAMPGVHFMAPFITDVVEISIRETREVLNPVQTITKDGIANKFSDIEVLTVVNVNKVVNVIRKFGMDYKKALIFNRIKEELRKYCANHTIDEVYTTKFLEIVGVVQQKVEFTLERLAPGSVIIKNLEIPKPDVPPEIARNYMAVKIQWTRQLEATQKQKTEAILKKTEEQNQVADARRQKAVQEIEIEKEILQKEGSKKLSDLENEIIKDREQNLADVDTYKRQKLAESNTNLYTKEYVQLKMAENLSKNTKFFFSGEQSALGALLNNVLGTKELN